MNGENRMLQESINSLRTDVTQLRTDMATKEDVHKVAEDQAKLRGELHEFKHDITQLITDKTSEILKVVADFAAQMQTVDRREIINSYRLDRAETRLDGLEIRFREKLS